MPPFPHIHANATSILLILAVMVVTRYLVTAWAAKHSGSPAMQGLASVLG